VLEDERTGERYDYSRKRGVLGAEIILPDGAPSWMLDRSALWNAVEIIEKRKDAQLARDFVIALPHELDHDQRVALTREFVHEQFCARGYVADIAWHAPSKAEGLNWHAHVMVAMRRVEGTGFAAKKERPAGDGLKHPALAWKEELGRLREAWANTANKHLEAAGFDIRIDHRSLEARGVDREPEPKQGPLATKIEREGRDSRAGAERREVKARNAERARLKVEHAKAITEEARIVDLMTQRLKGDGSKSEPLTDELLRQQQKREMDLLREMREQDERLQAFKRRLKGDGSMPEALTEELLRQQQKREMDLLRRMREQDERLQAFKRQAEQDAEEARRKPAETARDEERRQREGDIASASARYSIALGEQYDVRDPYGSLARAAMQEYAMFHCRQEQMRLDIASESDPEKRRIIELKRTIEGQEYMAITSERLAGMSGVITGRSDSPQAALDRDRARAYQENARELREERSRLIEERETRDHADKAARPRAPDQAGRPDKPGSNNDNKRQEEQQMAKVGGRKEGPVEMTDAKREKLARMAETETAYAQHDAAKQHQHDHGMGGRGGR
jgi:hypothetical protein